MQDIGPDLWDYEYWKRVEEGVDCDGRIGPGEEGFFCYCPSQGYRCSCKPSLTEAPGITRNMCYDHYGWDC